ncbi:MAG: SufS family cysteine desulfurase [Spirochaetaceae bacterium]|nr:MAG: SufS family cysteine desulfurase [Spirochaetaceae bacterium]
MTSSTDIIGIRSDFPALNGTMRGKDLVYFDNGATSLKPQIVMDALDGYYREYSANIHRGVYEMSERATAAFDRARETMYRFLGVDPEKGEVIFTRGTTESINLVAYAWGMNVLGPEDEIVLTAMEHHSNIVPWQQVARRTGASLRFIPLTEEGTLEEDGITATIGPRTRLVAITGMSNVTGYVPPLKTIRREARRHGALVLLDGAQYVSHHPVDVQDLDCDFLAFSGHKLCGPTGIGGLYARRTLLEQMEPFHFGGDMIREVHLRESTWANVPEKFEAGTPNIAGAIGMAAAAEYLMNVGMESIARHERELNAYMYDALSTLDYVTLYGPVSDSERGGIFSMNLEGVHAHDVGSLLDQQGVAVRTGFHCAQPLMAHFGITGTVRASFYLYNTPDEIDLFVRALERLYGILR